MDNIFTLNRSQANHVGKVLNANVLKSGRLVGKIWFVQILTWIFIAFAIRSLWDIHRHNSDMLITLLPTIFYLLMALSIYLAGSSYLRQRFARAAFSDTGWILSEQVLSGSDEGVTIKAYYGSVNLLWNRLHGVIEDDQHYYLLIEPCQGFMVPKWAIKDAELQTRLASLASHIKD
jgi:YcxB-like protein